VQEKISIITIIYKVEPYLSQCIESLINQTYENLEIILVVGVGGGDRCEEICDEYARRDPRIKVMKSPPKGVADARNRGLLAVTGDYIGFVDGDDWASKDMFSYLYHLMEENRGDIAICGKYLEYVNGTDCSYEKTVHVMTPEEAFEMILYQEGFFLHLWDKLFRKEIFDNIQFPVEERIEDRRIGYQLLGRAKKIIYGREPKIHFRVSEDSGSRVADNLVLSLEADKEMCAYIGKRFPKLKEAVDYFLVYETISVIQNNMLFGTYNKEKDRKYVQYVKKHGGAVLKNGKVSMGIKGKVLLSMFSLRLLEILTKKRRKKSLETFIPYSGLTLNKREENN
jgi:glycosyltransferase involved in cell wall biosynthesis